MVCSRARVQPAVPDIMKFACAVSVFVYPLFKGQGTVN